MTPQSEIQDIIDACLDVAIRDGRNWSPREVPADMDTGEREEYDPAASLLAGYQRRVACHLRTLAMYPSRWESRSATSMLRCFNTSTSWICLSAT